MGVSWHRGGTIDYVEINSPRVNAADLDMRQGLSKAVDWAEAEPGLERIVLSGAGFVRFGHCLYQPATAKRYP
ncbi:MAG: hypothetical protein QM492_03735 [Rhodobacterales bacterium]